MSNAILTHDAAVSAFDAASGVVSTTDDEVSFNWDEKHIVNVDAPADLTGAFDTERFYKIDGATIARPIKQPYLVGDELEFYKKPADELKQAAWSFDNAPFTLGHPDSGMVKNVDDIHGFWRNPRYNEDEDRLKEDLYIPVSDDEALEFIEDHGDVSVGFYHTVTDNYAGDTGSLTDDDVDGFHVQMYGDHIAGVKEGRCSGEDGCGLDDNPNHGEVVNADERSDSEYTIAPPTADYTEDGTYYAIAPDETSEGGPKYPINSCSDVSDAWQLRGHGDYDISQSTLEDRIKSKARDLGCDVPGKETTDAGTTEDCGCNTNMSDKDTDGSDFDIPDLSVDAIAEQNDAISELKEERDSLRQNLDEMESEIEDALDSAENFDVHLEEDECVCDAVEDLVAELDDKAETAEEVEDLQDELEEYREEEREEALDTLSELGADTDEYEDESLDTIEEEIDRRKEVLESADADVSVKNTADSGGEDDTDSTQRGSRSFGRGHAAN
jgi:hypothetical protein